MPLDITRVRPPVLERALGDPFLGRIALVSSFGADAVALTHMVSEVDKNLPVFMIDTEMLFPETLTYQEEVAAHLGLTSVHVIRAKRAALLEKDADGILHVFDPDACCHLRKVDPLETALDGFNTWISGRRRDQSAERARMAPVERDRMGRIKLNPLADWSASDVAAYIRAHDLPRHPLVAEGYASIGCAPCTSKIAEGEDQRAGRWRGQKKSECGLHFEDGKLIRPRVA